MRQLWEAVMLAAGRGRPYEDSSQQVADDGRQVQTLCKVAQEDVTS